MAHTAEQVNALVISDADGNYYVLPREVIETAKVGADTTAAVEQHVTAEDSGYSLVGAIALSDEAQLAHFTPDTAWPNGG